MPRTLASAPGSCWTTSAPGSGRSGSPRASASTFHRHVLDYFWTCVSGGDALSRDGDGNIRARRYEVAETRALSFGEGESMIHDLENTGTADIVFTTVEFLDSANAPLPLADTARA